MTVLSSDVHTAGVLTLLTMFVYLQKFQELLRSVASVALEGNVQDEPAGHVLRLQLLLLGGAAVVLVSVFLLRNVIFICITCTSTKK